MWSFTSVVTLLLQGLLVAAQTTITSTGNPIIADGSYYSADPAPLVVNNTVYILSGRDQAPANQNTFAINEWQMLSSSNPNVPSGSSAPTSPVRSPSSHGLPPGPPTRHSSDRFAIGVAVSSNPWGPFTDAHPSGPIVSQTIPQANNIQNIDPTVLLDDTGRVYLYWGTFGALRGIELATDMVTTIGSAVISVTGFVEAPWLLKRRGTYYMLYAANNAGANSPCTPTSYHACIAYGTSSSPLGPWTFRGVMLDIVSSTTSHPGAFELNGQWYLVYHTRDASGGGHFRRSVALDYMTWNDNASPPSINKVVQTRRAQPAAPATRNIAPRAVASSVNQTPIQYWTKSLNDGWIPSNPLPPDYWSSYNGNASPQTNTLVLTWSSAVTLNGGRGPAGGVEHRRAAPGELAVGVFEWERTTALRAILTASGGNGQFGGVGVKEFEALAPNPQ
uniref:Xylosidase arabinosidase n=1 Tax=Colletotrichum fructicola (strain Nara gc5) TaxID=1213859 RepID=L2G207_COLFN